MNDRNSKNRSSVSEPGWACQARWRAIRRWLVTALALGVSVGLACAAEIGRPTPAAPAESATTAQTQATTHLREVHRVEGITELALPNGLQVLLVPDDSKPTTTVNLTVRVGSRHENYGETGMAHLLEHLLFKGSARHPRAWAEFARRGLRANGTTSLDRTNYFASFAANEDNLAWMIDWLADALVNSFVAKGDLDAEMTVVRNEMERGENSPGRILFQQTLAAMYQWHNYGKSTIGARTDVEQVDIARLQAFYRTWYRPDNATLIVSGRFEPARVQSWVVQSFGSIARPVPPLPRLPTLDPAQEGEREVTLRRAGGVPSLLVGYHSVPGSHRDQAAATVLAMIMGDAPSGRLHRRLVEPRLAASAWGWTPALHDPGYLMFGAELAPDQPVGPARQALLETLESVAREPLTVEEFERARARWLKSWEQGFSDPERVGVRLSEAVALGDWRLHFLARDRVRELTLADVQRFATQRLLAANRTVGAFLPTTDTPRAPAPARVDIQREMQSFRPQEAAASAEGFDASPPAIEERTLRGRTGGLSYALLPKGTRGQMAVATLRLHLGDAESLRGRSETAEFMAALLDKGSSRLSRQQVQDRLDALQADVSFGFQLGVLSARVQARRDTLMPALALAAELLRQPRFDPAVLEEVRQRALASVERARKDPEALVSNALDRHDNPYSRGDLRYEPTFDEQAQSLRAVTVQDLADFHARFVGAAQMEFAAVGDFDAGPIPKALAGWLADWVAPVQVARIPQPATHPAPARLVFPTPDKQNAILMVRQPIALSDRDADYPALVLANYLLGQGGQSRLWTRIREKEGLSYSVATWIDWNPYEAASTWQASAIFAPANRGAVEAAFMQEIQRALDQGFSAEEVAQGREGLLSFRRLSLAQDGRLVGTLAFQQERGETMARVEEVNAAISRLTPDQVNAALRRHLNPSRFVIGLGGDFK